MIIDMSLAQNSTTRAMSSGVPRRPIRLWFITGIDGGVDSRGLHRGRSGGHVALGRDEGRGDAEHADAEGRELERHLLGHAAHRVLRADVGREARGGAVEAGGRDDVDDDAGA